MRVLIIGGAGAFGSFYARLLSKNGFEVSISSRNKKAGMEFCKKNGFGWAEKSDAKNFDIVIVSVPNKVAQAIVKEIGPQLSKGTLLFDFCSVKKDVVKELKMLSRLDLELASIHPLHGPRINSIAGYPVVCISIKPGKKLEEIKKFFSKNGTEFFYSTAAEHDKFLSITQGLTHYAQFVSAAALRELGIDLDKSLKFGSPNYHLFLDLMSRVMLQNPELYAQIQLSNPENKKVWAAFKRQALKLDLLCRKEKLRSLEKKIVDSAKVFKEKDSFLLESDRAVNAINYFVDYIWRHIGKRYLLQNLATGAFHYGIIEDFSGYEILFNEKGKKTRLPVRQIRIAPKDEMLEWRQRNVKQLSRDYAFLVPMECNGEIIKSCLSQIKECRFEFLGEKSGQNAPQGKKIVSIRAMFFEDDEMEKIGKRITEIIKGLGF